MNEHWLENLKTNLPVFLSKLKNVADPEKKRKIIGNLFIKIFDQCYKN